VLKALFESPKTIGELGIATGIGQIALIETLAKMEIDEMIERYPGGRFIMK
jgi:DNA-binding HxlR family transcriptional regulator